MNSIGCFKAQMLIVAVSVFVLKPVQAGTFDWMVFLEEIMRVPDDETTTTAVPTKITTTMASTTVPASSGGFKPTFLNCGVNSYSKISNQPPVDYIKVGARVNEAPWLVRIIDKTTYRWFCNGVILGRHSVLAPASCFEAYRRYIIVAGDHVYGKLDDTEVSFDVKMVSKHPLFNPNTKQYDFAVAFTDDTIPLSQGEIWPVCVRNVGIPANSELTVFGWGTHSARRSNTLIKESGTNLVLDTKTCQVMYRNRKDAIISADSTICAGTGDGQLCNADPGSPLTIFKNGRHHLLGIATHVANGCQLRSRLPTVLFGKVSLVFPWIQGQLERAGVENTFVPTLSPKPDSTNTEVASEPECGKTAFYGNIARVPVKRIVGGYDGSIAQVPWQARISYWGIKICGGIVVNSRTVLTAAHCIKSNLALAYKVILGDELNYSNDIHETEVTISKVIVHEDYNKETDENDIAILITSKRIPLGSDSIRAACLPSKSPKSFVGKNATISGWGKLLQKINIYPDQIQIATVQVLSKQYCAKAYSRRQITDDMICAAGDFKDTCQGDSGGPLTIDQDGITTLIGITSYGRGCASAKYPGVYHRVSHSVEWIKSTLLRYGISI